MNLCVTLGVKRGPGLGDGELGLGSAASQCLNPWSVRPELVSYHEDFWDSSHCHDTCSVNQ